MPLALRSPCLSGVDVKSLSDQTCEVLARIDKQSPDITGGVHVGKDVLDVGVGDQTDVRKSGLLWWLRPVGEIQVTLQYLQ